MAIYKYSALSAEGKTVKNTISCEDLSEFYKILAAEKLYCIRVKEADAISFFVASTNTVLKPTEISVLCRQLSSMLSAGIQLSVGVHILYSQNRNKKIKDILQKLYQANQKGLLFSEALKSLPNTFPPFFISMVEAGEASGELDKTMLRLSVHYEKEAGLKNKIIQAMTYPIVLLAVTLLIVVFIFTIIFPRLEELFMQNANLPALTKLMMSISDFMLAQWPVLLVVLFSMGIFVPILYNVLAIRKAIDGFILRMPVLGILNTTVVTARFSRTFSELIASGMSTINAIEFSANVLNNFYLTDRLGEAVTNMKKGETMSSSFKKLQLFPIMFIMMLGVGEESGELADLLIKTSDFYDEEAEVAIKRMVSLIQPIMVLFMAVIVVMVMMAVMQPLYGGYQNLGV